MGAEDIAVKARAQERETPRVYSVGEAARKFEVSPDTIRRYEDAGAFGVELEVVAEPVATAIAGATPLTVISMGSGAGCDVQYLFAVDVLGETKGRIPRHARIYDNLTTEYERLQERRVKAFKAFAADTAGGQFPGPSEIIKLKAAEAEALAAFLAEPRQ